VKRAQLRLIGGRRLRSPQGQDTRPTTSRVREALMNMLNAEIRGCRWLDLCSGSGVMGCEAIQRGAAHVVAVEQDARTAAVCRENLELIASSEGCNATVKVIRQDLLRWLQVNDQESEQPFSIVYLDPPYAAGLYTPALENLKRSGLVTTEGLVICEYASKQPPGVPAGWREVERRRYGSSSLLILSPREHCRGDTDSTPQQTGPEV